jgi:D-xylose transport system ATP-binding protein
MTQTPSQPAPLLSLRGINKSFGAVHVLKGVNLDAYPGQVTALVGDNGAGKSTLIKGIAGIYTFDNGEYTFDGKPVTVHSPKEANALGIEVVYQDLALCDNLDVVQNMFLGRESKSGVVLDETSMEQRASETLKGLSVRTLKSVRMKVSSLSGGQRQTVAIARAVLWNSKLVILDEPTAALGVAQTEQVLNLVRRLADNGLAVILISHNMNDVMQVADNIAALYLGQMAAQVPTSAVTHGQVVELITAGRSGDLGLSPETAKEAVAGPRRPHPRPRKPSRNAARSPASCAGTSTSCAPATRAPCPRCSASSCWCSSSRRCDRRTSPPGSTSRTCSPRALRRSSSRWGWSSSSCSGRSTSRRGSRPARRRPSSACS